MGDTAPCRSARKFPGLTRFFPVAPRGENPTKCRRFLQSFTGFLGLTDAAFVFRWDAGTSGATVLLDNFKLEVPEPGVILLLAPGLVLLALARRRRVALARAA